MLSATRTLTLLSPSAFHDDDPGDGWVLSDGHGDDGRWLGVVRAQVSKFVANSGPCAPTGYVSLQVVSPGRSAYSTGLVYASRNGDSLFPTPIALDANGTADISATHVDAHGPLPQFLIVLGGSGQAPTSVDAKLSWTGVSNAKCTEPPAPTLTVVKHVVGGDASAARWSLHVKNAAGAEVANSPQAGSETGTTYTLSGGTFTVSETGDIPGYTGTFSGDCDASGKVTLAGGDRKTCTLTNSAAVAMGTLTVFKVVSGGSARAADWQIHVLRVGATDVSGSPQPGSAAGTRYALAPGAYTVSESGGPAGFTAAYSGDCGPGGAITIEAGVAKMCTLTDTFRDTTAPVISAPGDATATATSKAGAVVSFAVTATDPDDAPGDLAISCGPAHSGDTFPIGVSSVICHAHDPAGNEAEPVGFTVTVNDPPPALSLPTDMHDVTHDQAGKTETFDASATDFKDGALAVSCDHASGDTFPVGLTTVLCSATNSSKLTTHGSFTITIEYADATPPAILPPGDQVAIATSKDGAKVSFDVTATDPDNPAGDLTVVCGPLYSGDTFPIGATTVTCNAHDPA